MEGEPPLYKLIPFLKPYKKECILGPAFKLLEAILELLLPTIMALIINNGVLKKDVYYVIRMGGIMLLMAILGFYSSMICQYYAARASQGFGTTLRNTLFQHISSLSHAEIDALGTSSLVNRITNDVNQLQLGVAMLIRLVIRAPFICIGAIIMAMFLDLRLSLILLGATPIFAVILYMVISKTSPLYQKYQQRLDGITSLLRENLSGVRVIRAFAKINDEKKRFDAANKDVTDTALYVGGISALLNPLTSLVMNTSIIAILWVGGLQIHSGGLSQGVIIAFVNYVTQILLALIVVSNLVIIFTKAFASAIRVTEVLSMTPSITDSKRDSSPKEKLSAPAIEFNNVSFAYNQGSDQALSDISLSIYSGEIVGIIGGTGAGKTTFIHLISRFYEATEGTIYVHGIDVKEYPLHTLRKKISMVPQKALLFAGTIAENIRWGKPNATKEEIIAAAQVAQADGFIGKLPKGYDTTISRGGQNLSGGQKQRITIARALIAQAPILILDDASSALDLATDLALRKTLKQNAQNRTLLIVSQRVSSIQHADKILVFDDGYIVGIGSHEELRQHCEVYQEICLSQLSNEEVKR